ncbi:Peptidase family M48 [Bernardetia litoralis DSM 6794]|uniref:Peptidase family M48 n=1 Tax=Bernardetia litoralis (strain ATCC 23117 / DSM 6794 / NBRC 15988 / NCIMB 1366 / Fx l1 / Sio-4) TaxID=880071 RepID=I4AKJ1_BERLS|nr:M48 family metallopeptidase [Bernardetia litoralis]AFM04476.1 Peptidase family M48 [Bernardetia litoralis DSM 6794]
MTNYRFFYKKYFSNTIFVSILLIYFITITNYSYSQNNSTLNFENYESLKSKGSVPKDFLLSVSERYVSKNAAIEGEVDKKTAKTIDQFNFQSSFSLKQLLWSGNVIFGDEVSQYLNEIASELLKNDEELRNKVRFYVVKSPVPNAFANPDGAIFINLGLVARAESESQLAYILAHEITHYVKQHSINQFLFKEEVNSKKNKKAFRFDNKSEELYAKRLAQSNYSKEHEVEADAYGWELFKNTKYDLLAAAKTFDMLQNTRQPFDTLVFESKFLNNSYIQLPDSTYYMDTVHIVEREKLDSAEMEALMALSTHPSAAERKKLAIQRMQENGVVNGGKEYIVSKEKFETVQKIARFELCQLYLSDAKYIDALYHTLLLQEQYGDSKYIQISLTKALYGIAKYDNVKARIYLDQLYSRMDWQGRNWYFALEELDDYQLTVLALAHCFEMLDKYPSEAYLKNAIPSLLMDIKLYYSDFSKGKTVGKKKNQINYAEDLMYPAWQKIQAHAEFEELRKQGDRLYLGHKKAENRREEGMSDVEMKRLSDNITKGYALGINKIVMVNPFYIRLDVRKDQPLDIFTSDSMQTVFHQELKQNSKAVKLGIVSLNPVAFGENDAEKFNDLAIINSWYKEMGESNVNMIASNYDALQALSKKYGTPYFTRMIVIDKKMKFQGQILPIGIFIPVLPYVIYKAATAHDSMFITIMHDVNTGEVKMIQGNKSNKSIKKKKLSEITRSHLYQIKRKRR